MNCGLVDPLCYKDNFVRFLKMTCNLVNIWCKTCRKETQYLNCYSFGILNTSGTSKVFLKKCYVKNLTYINFICKCIAGFSLLLTDWKFKPARKTAKVNIWCSSFIRSKETSCWTTWSLYCQFWQIFNHSLERYFLPIQPGSYIDWTSQEFRLDDAWDPGARKVHCLSTTETTPQEFRFLCHSSWDTYVPI